MLFLLVILVPILFILGITLIIQQNATTEQSTLLAVQLASRTYEYVLDFMSAGFKVSTNLAFMIDQGAIDPQVRSSLSF